VLSFPLVGPDASGLKKDAEQVGMTENVTLLISFAIIRNNRYLYLLPNTLLDLFLDFLGCGL